jgi:glycosyltransferase involved in cell wall biosynthesis
MLKICHITSNHTAFDTRIFYKECMALKAIYHVVLLAPNAANVMDDGIEIKGYPFQSSAMLRNLIFVLKAARKQKADAYHIHDAGLLPLAWLLKLCGKKIIYDVHENYREILKERQASRFTQKAFDYLDHWAAKHCDVILAQRSYIPQYQGRARNMCVVENFCDVEALKLLRSDDRANCRKLVYIGTIHTQRGAIVMLEVLHILRERGLDIKLDLIGRISEPGLQKRIEELPFHSKIKNHVNWYGQLNINDSYRIAMESFVGLCLNESLPGNSESYPTKLFEYMVVGLPIVASNISLYRAVVERRECGICVPFDDAMAIADALEKIYNDKELLKQFSKNGLPAVAQNYNWAVEKNILLDFYGKILYH